MSLSRLIIRNATRITGFQPVRATQEVGKSKINFDPDRSHGLEARDTGSVPGCFHLYPCAAPHDPQWPNLSGFVTALESVETNPPRARPVIKRSRFRPSPSVGQICIIRLVDSGSTARKIDYETVETKPNRFELILRAFRSRNYKLFFFGQLISMVGNFLTMVATAWLVYRLAKESAHPERAPFLLGVVGFAGQVPMFLLAPLAGVWVDRVNRQKLLVITQTLAMLESFALAALALAHVITIPEVICLSIFQGFVNAFDIPGRQAFLVEMVENRENLANAIALNSTLVHGARLIGPALAGLLIAWVGEGWCFLIDGTSYIAVIAALLAMRITPRPRRAGPERGIVHEFAEGFRYVWGFVPIRVLLMLMAVMSLTAMPALSVLMPIFADALSAPSVGGGGGSAATVSASFSHGAETMGILMGMSGAGALVGAIYLAARRTVVGLGRVIFWAAVIFGIGLIAFSLARHLSVALLIVPFTGFGMIATFASANTLLQTLTDEDKRGRVMSFFTMAFIGMTPFGNLLIGSAAGYLAPGVGGARRAVMLAGAAALCAAIWFRLQLPSLRKIVRPIYVKKGILSEVATGMQAAAEVTEKE